MNCPYTRNSAPAPLGTWTAIIAYDLVCEGGSQTSSTSDILAASHALLTSHADTLGLLPDAGGVRAKMTGEAREKSQ